jgi:hypothetical protein
LSKHHIGFTFFFKIFPEVLPDLRQMWYCICDVQLPAAQKICRRDFLDTLRDCDPMTGWLPGVSEILNEN